MRVRILFLLALVFSAHLLSAKEVFLAVSGTANNVFFSDARIFNPNDKEITVQAYYLPRGNNDNSGEQAKSFTIPKREMKIYDDIVATLLQRGDVGGIRFVSPDDFVVTQRVYARLNPCASDKPDPCTLGQFVQGQELTAAIKNGVILQLKGGTSGFRTNIGAANPNNVPANVTWRLYDKNNALVATSSAPLVMPPYAVIGPTALDNAFFYNVPAGVNLSDAWVGFTSDQPIFAYGSVVDNLSTDQTYVPASADSGTVPAAPQNAIMTIHARDFEFMTSTTGSLQANSQVTFRISAQGLHGFQLVDPSGNSLINIALIGEGVREHTITLPAQGTYQFFCTNSGCGTGHFSMAGTFVVGTPGNPDGPGRY